MTDFKKIQEYYSVFNEDERLTTDYSGKLEYDMTMRKLKKYLPESAAILDLGGAAGAYTFPLASLGYQMYLADLSETLIDKAKEKVDALNEKNVISCNVVNAIDLNIYMKPWENERYLFLEMKREFIENYAIKFVEEQLKTAEKNDNQKEDYKNLIEQLKDKKYDDLVQIAEHKKYENFQLIEGSEYSNDISYITEELTVFADIISYIDDGKILMECYYDMFRYLRNLIIKSSINPIKTSVVISIIG